MYWNFIDTIKKTIDDFGVGIISDSRFWNIVADKYSFASDYSLRNTFKKCLKEGYIQDIASLRGNHAKTVAKISQIIEKLSPNSPEEPDLTAVLFSIAIGVGTCTKKDYEDFLKKEIPNQQTSTNIVPNSRKASKSASNNCPYKPLSSFGTFKRYAIVISLGLLVVLIGNFLYGLYFFCDCGLFLVLMFILSSQLMFGEYLLNSISSQYQRLIQSEIVSIGASFCVAFFANILASLFFQNDILRRRIYLYYSNWNTDYNDALSTISPEILSQFSQDILESPGFFSILFSLIGLLTIIFLIRVLFNVTNPKLKINPVAFLLSFSLIIVVEGLFLWYPSKMHEIQEKKYHEKQAYIDKLISIQEDLNSVIRDKRSSIVQNLSFREIKLGMPFDSASIIAEAIVDSNIASNCDIEPLDNAYFTSDFRENEKLMETLIKPNIGSFPQKNYGADGISGRIIKFGTSLDNEFVSVRVFEQEDSVFAITVQPLLQFANLPYLIKLYTQKYGEPELIRDRSFYEDSENPDKTIYSWTFKDGAVRLSSEYIVYMPTSLFKMVSDYSESKRLELVEQERKKKYLEFQQDSMKQVKQRQDSLQRIHNHKNAINEI